MLRVLASPDAEKWLLERSIQYNITSLKPKFQEAMVKLQKLYPEPAYVQDWAAAVKVAEVVPQDLQEIMGDEMAVLGDPDQVTHQILELKSLGVNRIFLRPCELFRFPEEELQAFKEVIGPALKKAS